VLAVIFVIFLIQDLDYELHHRSEVLAITALFVEVL